MLLQKYEMNLSTASKMSETIPSNGKERTWKTAVALFFRVTHSYGPLSKNSHWIMRAKTAKDDEFPWQRTASYFAYFKTTLVVGANSPKVGRILIWLIINVLRQHGDNMCPSFMRFYAKSIAIRVKYACFYLLRPYRLTVKMMLLMV